MLQELLDYIVGHQWEWTPKNPDPVASIHHIVPRSEPPKDFLRKCGYSS